eukprot:m.136309 g.136309  ORF g.136309 m.136309 type:complete len:380 (+) comp23951_c0_seq3:97-1236(+)
MLRLLRAPPLTHGSSMLHVAATFPCSSPLSTSSLAMEATNPPALEQAACIFSGIQPTGIPHLGNYLGAIANWVKLQQTAPAHTDIFFSVVDLHSMTVPQEPKLLRKSIENTAISLLACGIDPERATLFRQSDVSQHCELAWLLGCQTSTALLSHMIQWQVKKKSSKASSLGLFAYPVLMAADILLYKATHVPVGEDQRQHLELTRSIAKAFNTFTSSNHFQPPVDLPGHVPRVMSLRDPSSKMSKSDSSVRSRIDLLDDFPTIQQKLKKAVTDDLGPITYEPETRPGVTNLLTLYAACSPSHETASEVAVELEGKSHADLKQQLAEVVFAALNPIQEKFFRLENDKSYVQQVLQTGKEKAQMRASEVLEETKQLIGLKA